MRGKAFWLAAVLAAGSLVAFGASPDTATEPPDAGARPVRAAGPVLGAGSIQGLLASAGRSTEADLATARDVVGLSGGWQALVGPVEPQPARRPSEDVLEALGLRAADVEVQSAVLGDVDGDGADEVVVLFLRPHSSTMVGDVLPGGAPIDGRGRSQHLGVYDAVDLRQVWVAGTVLRPVSSVAVCEDVILLGYTSALGAVDRVGVGVITWRGYGFVTSTALPEVPGDGAGACADVDGHGRSQPVVLERTVT